MASKNLPISTRVSPRLARVPHVDSWDGPKRGDRLDQAFVHLRRRLVLAKLRECVSHVLLERDPRIRVLLEHHAPQLQSGLEEGEGLVKPANTAEGVRLVAHRADPARVLGGQHSLVDREHAVMLLQGRGMVAHGQEKTS